MEIPGKDLGKCGGSWENRERFFSFLNWDIIDKKRGQSLYHSAKGKKIEEKCEDEMMDEECMGHMEI